MSDRYQQSGSYHYDPRQVYTMPENSNSDQSINFQQPPPAAHESFSRSRQTSNYIPAEEDYYSERPSNIFTAPQPPSLQPLGHQSQNTSGSPFYDEPHLSNYELNDFHDYNNYDAQSQPLHHSYNHAFVPNVYADDDDDENDFDQRIHYGDFEGENYDAFQPVIIQPSEEELVDLNDPDEDAISSPFGDGDDETLDKPPPDGEQPQRYHRTEIQGHNGHLVLDCPVATELLSKFSNYNPAIKEGGGLPREFSHMRYTAVTCGPSNFENQRYVLRPVHYPAPRQTEMLVVITMYNEDDILLARTLKGVFKNIKHLESRTRSNVWGKDSWKKVVVCIVSDGRSKINERAQALLAGLGVYQEGLAKSSVDDQKVQAHVYEYTTRVGISSVEDTVKLTTEKIVPVQLLFCLKENNAKKINSHRWCFQAISQVLQPNIVVLLDAGTQPTGKSLYYLWKEFDRDPQVAGACGEIKASLKKRQILTNPLVYGQNFEYKISNILDKPTESVFGFISVLPGAFSAYRYIALLNDVNGKGPLEKYFKGEFLHSSGELDPNDDEYILKKEQLKEEAGIFTSNMYLAEDRILCFELVAKRGCSWVLRYCKSASAETDVPEHLAEFILQRRRWLNGSFFAAIYALAHFPKLWTSSHSFGKKFFLHIEFFYQFLNLVVSWFSIGSYFLVFRILTTSLSDSDLNFAPGNVLSVIFLWLYLASIVTTFVLSFGNTPKGTEKFYIVIVIFFAILMAYMIFAAIFMAVHSIQSIYASGAITAATFFKNEEFRDLVVATASTYALYFIASFLYFEPWHMFTSFAQYILLSPAYINVLNIYAFCNIDDISWGTKGDTGATDLGVAKVKDDGTFDVQIPIRAEEINQSYLNQLEKIKRPIPPDNGPHKRSNEDYYAFVRSMTVLVWMFSNFVIIALVLETAGINQLSTSTTESRSTIFLTVILWTVAFMALFRFIGCVLYLIQRFIGKFKASKSARMVKV
ncbi:chitin synthase 2 [[Candida] railenensis]|uniref:Chitin synthase n=1 Tax=[Candida] railenensis TaxID=45579 RepID=A0A9P0QN15_9ASCO|nr:chitin synthase 2 [[Candida] railenensis]